jgi:hypothetical protein
LAIRLLIISSEVENEPATRLNPANAPVNESFISIIYRQVKGIGYCVWGIHDDYMRRSGRLKGVNQVA